MEILNFQIKPYSDQVLNTIQSLPSTDIYQIFSNLEATDDILTAALSRIHELESKLPDNKSGIYFRDILLFSENINNLTISPNVFVLILDGRYHAHIYTWNLDRQFASPNVTDRVTNIVGLYMTKLYKMSSYKIIIELFINAIYNWCKTMQITGRHYIRYLQPSDTIIKVIDKCGFQMGKVHRNKERTLWLYDNGSLGDTILVKGLLFREYDYIFLLEDQLMCVRSTR